jgi:hypothetical protein
MIALCFAIIFKFYKMNDQDSLRASCLPVACTRQYKIKKHPAPRQTNRPVLTLYDPFCRFLPLFAGGRQAVSGHKCIDEA